MAISGQSRKIQLRTGGVFYVGLEGATIGDFAGDERELFERVVDAIHAYERKQPPTPESQSVDALRSASSLREGQ